MNMHMSGTIMIFAIVLLLVVVGFLVAVRVVGARIQATERAVVDHTPDPARHDLER